MPQATRPNPPVLWLLPLTALLVAVFWSAWAELYDLATRHEEYGHILLAPLMAGWLAWLRRERLADALTGPRWPGLGILFVGLALSLVGEHRLIETFWFAGALLAVCGVVVAVTGIGVIRRFAAAWGALLFILPLPGVLRPYVAAPLQTYAAACVDGLYRLAGGHIELQGSVLLIRGVPVAVGEACNGMRMLVALILIVYTAVFTWKLGPRLRLLFIALSPVVALVANVIRLIPAVWGFGHLDAGLAEQIHDASGWAMLVVLLAALGWFVIRHPTQSSPATRRLT
ncbi:MAG: exosortase/archaeosortase family protein [Planctomycetota bacterium]